MLLICECIHMILPCIVTYIIANILGITGQTTLIIMHKIEEF